MALEIDLVCVAFFVILTILGPHFYQLMDEVDWVGWCRGLNLGMGIVVGVAGISPWKQKPPAYTSAGVFLGALSIYLSASPFAYVK
jgi:hypothetical protein